MYNVFSAEHCSSLGTLSRSNWNLKKLLVFDERGKQTGYREKNL